MGAVFIPLLSPVAVRASVIFYSNFFFFFSRPSSRRSISRLLGKVIVDKARVEISGTFGYPCRIDFFRVRSDKNRVFEHEILLFTAPRVVISSLYHFFSVLFYDFIARMCNTIKYVTCKLTKSRF